MYFFFFPGTYNSYTSFRFLDLTWYILILVIHSMILVKLILLVGFQEASGKTYLQMQGI